MRLLSTTALEFGDFFTSPTPRYCILSHRWGSDEVTYDQVVKKSVNTSGDGYKKLLGSCKLARSRGYDWIWIDTCCINKESSAELTEAINSMFKFYSEADLCIAYLADVPALGSQDWCHRMDSFCKSVWFGRGWTLQELLAPNHLEFFDYSFQLIGSKAELSTAVSDTTGIAAKYLNGRRRWNYASVATRMSWAARRSTTRVEDEAYSLLGIFGVNMPLLYGEGKMAFFRLQREILANSNDESIFAWIRKDATDDEPFGLLAESTRDFAHSQCVTRIDLPPDKRPPVSLTSRGLEILHGFKEPHDDKSKTFIKEEGFVSLACKRRSVHSKHGESRIVTVCLREINGAWYRVKCNRFFHSDKEFESGYFQTFYVAQPNLTTTPRFSGNRRDWGATIQQQRQEEEIRKDMAAEKAIKYVGGTVLLVSAGVVLKHALDRRPSNSSRSSRRRSRSRSRRDSHHDSR